jgi:hypothetical protein
MNWWGIFAVGLLLSIMPLIFLAERFVDRWKMRGRVDASMVRHVTLLQNRQSGSRD